MTKPTKWHVRPAKTQISMGIHPVWSEFSLSAWRKLGSLATRWTCSEDSDQTRQMPRLGAHAISLVLSWGGSNASYQEYLARYVTLPVTSIFNNNWCFRMVFFMLHDRVAYFLKISWACWQSAACLTADPGVASLSHSLAL